MDNALYRNAKTGGQEISNNKKPRSSSGVFRVGCLAVSYSRMANATLPSALPRFTSEFGMG
ncbi:hypothetical protein ACEU6F_22260, partial [Aeromonas salmonicida]|uniref:hypothetical protein n=1 Tax=Aeromonas salmonicida TaxID=645 RepID=UPI0035A5CC9F